MSKTFIGIIEIAASIALQFIPGVGQVEGILAGLTLAASGLSNVFAPGPPKPPGTETARKDPVTARESGYGEGRHHMAFDLYVTDKSGYAIDVGSFHDGLVDSITGYYLGDTKIVLLPDGRVQRGDANQFGEFSDIVKIYTRLGQATETAFSQVIARIPDQWTVDHRGDGVATGCVITAPVSSKGFQMVFPTGGPNNMPLSLVMRRQLVFDWRDPSQSVTDPTTWRYSENAVLALAHYLLVRDGKTWARHFAPTLAYWTAAANDCDVVMPLKGVQAVLTATALHGVTHLTLNTIDGLSPGMTVLISSTGNTSLTEVRTVDTISGMVISFSPQLVNDHPLGSQVTWASNEGAPATEPRYRTCFAHDHTTPHKKVKAGLLACFDGWMAVRSDGALVVYSGRYYEPTVSIGPDQIVSYSLQDGIATDAALNQLSVTYVSAAHDFNVVDTDSWENTDDITARGKVLSDNLANQVPSHSQGRRLAKRKMAQVSAPKRGTTTTNAAGRVVLGQRYIRQDLTDAGTTFLNAVVEIVAPVKRNLQTGGVTFNWILADPNVDAWNPATEEGDPAPVGNRIASAPLDTPTITSAVADFSAVADSGTGVRLTIIAAGLNRSDVQWFARWRVLGSPTWNEQQYPDIDPGPSVTLETAFVPTKATIETEVAYGIGDGRVSPYSTAALVDTSTDVTAPDAASAITLVSWSDALNLQTGRIPRASTYRWRFYAPSDLSTVLYTIITTTPSISFTGAQALAVPGLLRRDYVVTVAGVNAGGAGQSASTTTLSLPAPAAVTNFAAADGTNESEVTFDLNTAMGVVGYIVASATVSNFDPYTQGSLFTVYGTPAYLQNLAAGSFFAKAAAFDAWTSRPDLLNFSAEDSYAISTGGGGVGGGGGAGGGGYCVTIDTPVLLADGTERAAGDLVVGDVLRTQHETTLEWGDYPVEAISFVEDDVLAVDIGNGRLRATAAHRMWIGGGWIRMDAIGSADGRAMVARITVTDAHTYVSGGVLSHNIKQYQQDQ